MRFKLPLFSSASVCGNRFRSRKGNADSLQRQRSLTLVFHCSILSSGQIYPDTKLQCPKFIFHEGRLAWSLNYISSKCGWNLINLMAAFFTAYACSKKPPVRMVADIVIPWPPRWIKGLRTHNKSLRLQALHSCIRWTRIELGLDQFCFSPQEIRRWIRNAVTTTVCTATTLQLLDTVSTHNALTLHTDTADGFWRSFQNTRKIMAVKFFTTTKAKKSTIPA